MELSREILKQFAQIANGNSNKKQTTPSYMNATAVVSDGVKYVQIDGSDQMTPVSETMGIQNGDRVLVTIENHQATVIGNYSYPADARTANEALSVGGQALTAAGQAIQRIDVLQASSITTENLQAGLATIGYLTATELRALNATVDTLDAKAITTDTLETESAKIGFVKAAQIEGTYATIEQLNAATARIGTLETDTLKSKDLESEVGKFGYLKADEAKLTYATIEQLNAKTVTADEILGVVIKAGYLTADNADLKYATITSLNAATARIGTLETDTLKTKDLESEVGKFGYLKASNLESEVGKFGYLKASNLESEVGEFGYLKASDAALQYATIGALNAEAAKITNLNADFAQFQNTVTQDIVAAKGWMAEGSIGDAQISKVSANKLDAGTIDTSVVTVKGSDGKLQIVDNTLQISDANRVRVQVGKDGTGDYSLAVWDVNGQLIWDALGATENTIQRAIIRDNMVAGDAAIQALKIDFQSFETALTQQGLTISGTVVQVGDKQLNVVLSEQTQYVDNSIAGIEIGGRNLIPNSNFANGTDGWVGSNVQLSISNMSGYDGNVLRIANINGGSGRPGTIFACIDKSKFVHESNTTYTLSFVARSSNANHRLYSAVLDYGTSSYTCSKSYAISTSQWEKYTYTYTTGEVSDDAVLMFWILNGAGPIYITNIKLEKGNKATDWTPAPEDVQGQIDTHTTKISSNETRITANEEAINLRVTSQEFTEYQNGVTSRFESAESSLSVEQRGIVAEVTQTEISNIQIGSRNLIRNAETLIFENYYFEGGSDKFTDENGNVLTDENGNTLIVGEEAA